MKALPALKNISNRGRTFATELQKTIENTMEAMVQDIIVNSPLVQRRVAGVGGLGRRPPESPIKFLIHQGTLPFYLSLAMFKNLLWQRVFILCKKK